MSDISFSFFLGKCTIPGDTPVQPWMLADADESVHYATFCCMAGPEELCSHVPALLAVHIGHMVKVKVPTIVTYS